MFARTSHIAGVTQIAIGVALSVMLIPFGAGAGMRSYAEAALPGNIRGIRIHYEYDRAAYFPPGWLEEPINCQGSQVDLNEAQRAVPLIEEFAAVYSAAVLRDHLTDIYLLGSLQCYGKIYGGTNSTSSIYIRVSSESEGYDAHYLLSTMHAEFSSILWRSHNFPVEAWGSLNPRGFEYGNDPVAVLEQPGITDKPSQDLFCGGFLTRYGTSDPEDDFNDYAGAIFVQPEELCHYRSECKGIADKAWMAIEFYRSVDPGIKVPACN